MSEQSKVSKKEFTSAKQLVILRPNSTEVLAFIYHDFSDLKNLIKFVGSRPTIDEDGKLWFRKNQIPENSVVIRDSFGQVTHVMKYDDAATKYTIISDSEFLPAHAAIVKTREISAEGKMSKVQIQEELTKLGVEFPKWNITRDQLEELLNQAKSKSKK